MAGLGSNRRSRAFVCSAEERVRKAVISGRRAGVDMVALCRFGNRADKRFRETKCSREGKGRARISRRESAHAHNTQRNKWVTGKRVRWQGRKGKACRVRGRKSGGLRAVGQSVSREALQGKVTRFGSKWSNGFVPRKISGCGTADKCGRKRQLCARVDTVDCGCMLFGQVQPSRATSAKLWQAVARILLPSLSNRSLGASMTTIALGPRIPRNNTSFFSLRFIARLQL